MRFDFVAIYDGEDDFGSFTGRGVRWNCLAVALYVRAEMLNQICTLTAVETPQETPHGHFLHLMVFRDSSLRSDLLVGVLPVQAVNRPVRHHGHGISPSTPALFPESGKGLPRNALQVLSRTYIVTNFNSGRPEDLFARLSISSNAMSLSWIMIIVCPRTVSELSAP